MMTDMGMLGDLVIVFGVGVGVVAALRRLGVPSIAGLIAAGLLVGPGVLGLIDDPHNVEVLAEVGVVLLLFGIGLELSIDRLKRLLRPILMGGALQMGITAAVAIGLAQTVELPWPQAVFLGFLAAVSSTAIVLRSLSDRREVEAPHGKLTLGILVFQDLMVVPMMIAIPVLSGRSGGGLAMALAVGKAVAVLAGVLVAAWLVVPRLLHQIAATRQRDLFVLAVSAVCLGIAWGVSLAGISLALGAFLAGLVVADSEYRHQALAELVPFREVFASLFFVSVGMLLDIEAVRQHLVRVALLVLGVVLVKFLVVVLTGLLMRLSLRVAVLSGAALAQVGEFSFVLLYAAAGTTLVPPGEAPVLAAVAVVTMMITPLGLAAGPHIAAGAQNLGPLTRLLDMVTSVDEAALHQPASGHVIIAGYGVAGHELARVLRERGVPHVVVDLNPANVRRASRDGARALYGDITSREVLEHLGVDRADSLVLAISDSGANHRAVLAARSLAPRLPIAVRAMYATESPTLLAAGATEVFSAEIATAIEMVTSMLGRHGVSEEESDDVVEELRARWERAPGG